MLVDMPLRSVRDIVLLLRSVPNMGEMDPGDMELLAEQAKPRRYEAGDLIDLNQDGKRSVHIITHGRVEIAREFGVEVVDAPSGAGFVDLIADIPAPTVRAATRAVTLEIPADFILATFEENFTFVRNGISGACGGVRLPADDPDPWEC